MSSYIDMSLEDIIKKRKNQTIGNKMKKVKSARKQVQPLKLQVTDARNKIISKKRTQITDAREKLAELAKQKDARLKLEKLRLERAKAQFQRRNTHQNHGKFMRIISNKDTVFVDSSRQVVSQPLKTSKFTPRHQVNPGSFMKSRSIERKRFVDKVQNQKPKPILRTVENDLEIIDDPMEDEYEPPKLSSLNRKTSLQLKIVAHNNDVHENRFATVHRSAIREKEKSPPRLTSILKKRPMAALRDDGKSQKEEKPQLEYRIIVSNLRNTVTAGDIEELFGDVGGMVESRLVRPGTAEVIYKTQEHAQKAVDLYHNRQLDGQPMNCLLVTPKLPSANARSSSTKPALYSTNSNVEPDISTFHKVLFSNL